MAKQVEDVGDVGIEREEQFGQSKYPGGSGQPQSVRLALLQRRAVEQQCRQSIEQRQYVLATDLEIGQAAAGNEGARQPGAVDEDQPPDGSADGKGGEQRTQAAPG